MAISVAKQFCPDRLDLTDPLRTIQNFDFFGTQMNQMEFGISTEPNEVRLYFYNFTILKQMAITFNHFF